MAYKQTWAIIGATTASGQAVAKAVAPGCRLLLMDQSREALNTVVMAVKEQHPQAEIEAIDCCKEASWEADTIVVAVAPQRLEEVAAKLQTVTNRKPVVHLTGSEGDTHYLHQALPHAKVVSIWLAQPLPQAQDAVLHGTDDEALRAAHSILERAVCK